MQNDLALHLDEVLAQLRAEKALLDQVIGNLERLDVGRKRPRGRPAGRSRPAHKLTQTQTHSSL
ncbi:MAG TPA: hypothetical protein VG456_11370 [Candidatus Sulfopaludibacter sp.]|jgi:hypothetical protein|nr:hypothetical protein [Candidatus Sulfopaludibacter sp.]